MQSPSNPDLVQDLKSKADRKGVDLAGKTVLLPDGTVYTFKGKVKVSARAMKYINKRDNKRAMVKNKEARGKVRRAMRKNSKKQGRK